MDSPKKRLISDYASIDWEQWQGEKATLLFLRKDDQILLIRKKRGLGKGKINGPGGRLDPGETLAECAVREVPGVRSARVELVWEPPWSRDRLDMFTRLELGWL